ncbi:MAG TPA: NosD domain-containing protein, partial [Pirellulaceae bacterium]
AWSQTVGGVPRVYALEFAGTAWQELAGSATGSGISPSTSSAAQPTIAYHNGQLYAAWQQFLHTESNESEIFAARFSGSIWEPAGPGALAAGGASSTAGTASHPRLAVGGGNLHLAWVEDLRSADVADRTTIYSTRWDGAQFVERFSQSGDTAGGITGTDNGVHSMSLAVNPSGQPHVAWSTPDSGSPQVYVRGDTLATNRVLYTSEGISLQTITEVNTLQPGDVIVIARGSEIGPVTLTAAHSGVFIIGTDEGQSRIDGLLTLDGANNVTIARVDLAGGLSVKQTTDLEVTSSRIGGTGLYLDGTTDTRVVNNEITSLGIGLTLNCNIDALIQQNQIHGTPAGVRIVSDETGSQVLGNAITSAGVGLDVDANLMGGTIR